MCYINTHSRSPPKPLHCSLVPFKMHIPLGIIHPSVKGKCEWGRKTVKSLGHEGQARHKEGAEWVPCEASSELTSKCTCCLASALFFADKGVIQDLWFEIETSIKLNPQPGTCDLYYNLFSESQTVISPTFFLKLGTRSPWHLHSPQGTSGKDVSFGLWLDYSRDSFPIFSKQASSTQPFSLTPASLFFLPTKN